MRCDGSGRDEERNWTLLLFLFRLSVVLFVPVVGRLAMLFMAGGSLEWAAAGGICVAGHTK